VDGDTFLQAKTEVSTCLVFPSTACMWMVVCGQNYGVLQSKQLCVAVCMVWFFQQRHLVCVGIFFYSFFHQKSEFIITSMIFLPIYFIFIKYNIHGFIGCFNFLGFYLKFGMYCTVRTFLPFYSPIWKIAFYFS